MTSDMQPITVATQIMTPTLFAVFYSVVLGRIYIIIAKVVSNYRITNSYDIIYACHDYNHRPPGLCQLMSFMK